MSLVFAACGGQGAPPEAAPTPEGATASKDGDGGGASDRAAEQGGTGSPGGDPEDGGGAGAPPDPPRTGQASEPDAAAPEAGSQSSVDSDASVFDRPQWPSYPEVTFPPENPYTEEKAILGKLLFWDEQLSSDNTVACGTCHRPAAGGSDPRPAAAGYVGHPGADGERGTEDDPKGSPGITACREVPQGAPLTLMDEVFGEAPRVGRRRSMTVLDAMFWNLMFWDGRVGSALRDPMTDEVIIPKGAALEAQALAPVLNTAEMACEGRDWEMAVRKIAAAAPLDLAFDLPPDLLAAQTEVANYSELFEKVFGDRDVTPVRVAMAIATYERTLTANQTPWDRWLAGDDDAMSEQERRGFKVFAEKGLCTCCHTAPLFGLPALVNDAFHARSWDGGGAEMGMDRPGDYTDPTFRTVTVRNAGLREAAGLLHDGNAPGNSLEALIAAYNEEPARDVHFCRRALDLTEEEQADLVAFSRNALTDPRVAGEAPPFDRPKLSSEAEEP